MKTRAFILIETAVGRTREVADILKGVENITSLDLVTGPHDIITIVAVSYTHLTLPTNREV